MLNSNDTSVFLRSKPGSGQCRVDTELHSIQGHRVFIVSCLAIRVRGPCFPSALKVQDVYQALAGRKRKGKGKNIFLKLFLPFLLFYYSELSKIAPPPTGKCHLCARQPYAQRLGSTAIEKRKNGYWGANRQKRSSLLEFLRGDGFFILKHSAGKHTTAYIN